MNTLNQIKIIRAGNGQRQAITSLLQSEKLPVDDLPASLDNFFIAVEDDAIIGAIGLEQYGNYGLLRSMVVNKDHRNRNIASQLVRELEKHAVGLGIDTIYLLTETAPFYFEKKGYQRIAREEVPEPLKVFSEFSHVCPVSAIVMKKQPDKNPANVAKKILVLCTGNSCRSQMAEGYLKHFAGDKAEVYSAGVETHGVNPKAIRTMKEDGIDISHHTSNNVNEYRNIDFDYVITVCDNAKERCPFFPSRAKKFHHNFPDPAKATGTEAEINEQFKNVRQQIKDYCRQFVADNVSI